MDNLIFLKLGGSLITDKERPRTPRLDRLEDLCNQIASVLARDPNLRLLIGHGSGSFGHVAAKKYKTRDGLSRPPLTPPLGGRIGNSFEDKENNPFPFRGKARMGAYWRGFTEVWHEARELNKIVLDALRDAKIPSMAIAPSSGVIARNGEIAEWNLEPIKRALSNGITPIVYGDVVFDEVRGGTILSTEDLFMHLAREMRPERILLAGLEDGIYADFPARKKRVRSVTPASYEKICTSVGASAGTDVTGGMDSKVSQMLTLVKEIANLEVFLFSGEKEGSLKRALRGENLGTLISFEGGASHYIPPNI